MAKDDLQRAVDALVFPAKARTLPALPGVVPLPATTRAVGPAVAGKPGGSGGGIASPLTETAVSRTYHATPQTIYSSDGVLAFRVRALQQVTLTDANGAEVIMIYQPPA